MPKEAWHGEKCSKFRVSLPELFLDAIRVRVDGKEYESISHWITVAVAEKIIRDDSNQGRM